MEQVDVLKYCIDVLERLGITYMVVGSFASGAYGEPRLTQDIDIVIEPQPGQIEQLCDAFPSTDFYVSREAAARALEGRAQFNVIHPDSGNKIDFMISSVDAWGREQIARRRRAQILPDREAAIAEPADIILSKMRYYQEGGSEKHLRDIAGILKVSGEKVDRAYVERWAQVMGLMEIWRAVLNRIGG